MNSEDERHKHAESKPVLAYRSPEKRELSGPTGCLIVLAVYVCVVLLLLVTLALLLWGWPD